MKAGVIHRFGGPEVLRIEEIGQPQAKPGEVLIRLRAAGLNRADVLVREGRFAELDKQQPLPIILGVEGAGDIAGLGEGVSSLRVGQRVAVLPMLTCGTCPECDAGRVSECAALTIVGEHVDGTYAQYIALPARNAIPVPEQADLTYEQLSVSIVAYMTAWHMLRTRGGSRRARRCSSSARAAAWAVPRCGWPARWARASSPPAVPTAKVRGCARSAPTR
ncbi:alcohol dehydrogenase catalytic domain-containing protein [Actinomadura madurae]|uniref:alcohol dehydrogenase catalytic domain-containing protein n=1 Tax=Actinomadura madurae TaxID=1993 RepID=UPI002025CD6B|nr:alcohol dehydrogenase catalytic domain-containing protein [Actinomadura madurae]URN03300.1 alcohol dehydrogenase catalytic domain-containing protein [Actinomadura madurae]